MPLQNLVTIFSTRFDNWTPGRSKQKNSWQDLTMSILLVLKSGPEEKNWLCWDWNPKISSPNVS